MATPRGTAHTIAAGLHYVAFVATPVPAWRSRGAPAISGVAAAALLVHATGLGPNRLFQRIGLSILDIWLVVAALHFATRREPVVRDN